MADYRYCVSLKITHPDIKAKSISDMLLLEPSQSHDVGELRATINGRLLGGKYEDTYWNLDLCNGQRIDAEDLLFEEFIEQKNKEFSGHKDFFNELRSNGGTIEYFVGWFSTGSINMNIYLDPPLLKNTADLGISFVLCAYPEE